MNCSMQTKVPKRLGPALVASVLALFMACGTARAGLLGDTVNITRHYPTSGVVESNLGDQVVTGGVEFPSWQGLFSVDVSDGNILFTALDTFGFVNGPFNGFILTNLSFASITGASINAATTASGLLPSDVTFDSARVFINMEWMSFVPGRIVSVDVQTQSVTAIPEPSTYALMLAGLAAVAFAARRRRAQVHDVSA